MRLTFGLLVVVGRGCGRSDEFRICPASVSRLFRADKPRSQALVSGGHEDELMMAFNVVVWLVAAAWYVHSLQFALVTSAMMKSFHVDPQTATASQLAAQAVLIVIVASLWSVSDRRALLSLLASWDVHRQFLFTSLCFAIASWATCAALVGSSIGLTYIVKALEPLFALALLVIIDGHVPTTAALGAVCLAVLGCVITVASSFEVHLGSLVLAAASNLFQQLRNVYGKHMLGGHALPEALLGLSQTQRTLTLQLFWSLQGTVLLLLIAPLLNWAMQHLNGISMAALEMASATNDEPEPAPFDTWAWLHHDPTTRMRFTWAATHFAMYQLAAVIMLVAVTPLFHSLLNSLKRGIMIFGSTFLLGLDLSTRQSTGILLTLLGVYGYARAQAPPNVPQGKDTKASTDSNPASKPSTTLPGPGPSRSSSHANGNSTAAKHQGGDAPLASPFVVTVLLVSCLAGIYAQTTLSS
ncbi:uncharacterized protein MONBRDRAFT_8954 [Monosiga brevicollis MX1]|uniref:Sugar phosphate transporter domain-containing protein n=1 Tax=Monosiga brevicollis TaxID=81824 RepID=A9V1M2_MONBE|nr:uncharacterized protein MONBRDRAFT_8954 [Monosiga brevicollis MX1]EDQ88464.1 predicted protein [Monosiga brevicollis MX1]|eukprot:XP_001746568.1 hypothetical protein [Monosiga brevicollis MX1]